MRSSILPISAWKSKNLNLQEKGVLICISKAVQFDFDRVPSRKIYYRPSLSGLSRVCRADHSDLMSVQRLVRKGVLKRMQGHANLYLADPRYLVNQFKLHRLSRA